MCGIVGTFGYTPDPPSRLVALAALRRRGPDESGELTSSAFWIGHTLLAITDAPGVSKQPMLSPCGKVCLAFNGEIFNAASLRQRCSSVGFRFRSKSDTEALLASYLCLGNRFVEHLEGIFAFALIDFRSDEPVLFLSRDASGIKPLYIERNGEDQWAFASELSAVRTIAKKSDEVSVTSLALLLSSGIVPQPRSIYASTTALAPGKTLRLTLQGDGRIECREHYASPAFFFTRDESTVEELGEAMELEIANQVADLDQVHLFLGGGIDSAVLGAFAAKAGRRVHAHTLSLTGISSALDETKAAHDLAKLAGWTHHVHIIREEALAENVLNFASLIDQPTVDGLNSYLISSAVNDVSRVAFSGTGPDEFMFGYSWMNDILHSTKNKSPDYVELANEWIRRCTLFSDHEIARLIGIEPKEAASARLQSTVKVDLGPDLPLESRLRNICLHRFTADRLLRDLDVVSMANGVEVRVPLLGRGVAKACWGVSPDQFHGSANSAYGGVKQPIVEIARRLFPEQLFRDSKKRSFMLPFEAWMRGPLRDVFDEVFRSHGCSLIDNRIANGYWSRFLAGESVALKAWLLGIIMLWFRNKESR